MEKLISLFTLLIISHLNFSQGISVSVNSKILGDKRQVHVYLPDNYTKDNNYPTIYVLDGDYLGAYVNGIIKNNVYWDRAPECIVVSILQKDTRWKDGKYNSDGDLTGTGKDFFDFFKTELIPFIDTEYSTNNYRALIGHSYTANFVNFFMLDGEQLFRGFVCMSPYFSNKTEEKVVGYKSELAPSFFLSIGGKDLTGHIESVNDHKAAYSNNPSIAFNLKKYKNATHVSLVNASLSDGISYLFKNFGSFDSEHYKLMKKDSVSAFNYFMRYYENITTVFDIDLKYRSRDAEIVSTNIERSKNWEELNKFGDFCIQHFPDEYFGYYNKANYFKSIKNFSKALEYYELGYSKLGDDTLNKSDFFEDIIKIKKKL